MKTAFPSHRPAPLFIKTLGEDFKGEREFFIIYIFYYPHCPLSLSPPPAALFCLQCLHFWGLSEPISGCALARAIWRLFARLLQPVGLCHGLPFPSLLLLPKSPLQREAREGEPQWLCDWLAWKTKGKRGKRAFGMHFNLSYIKKVSLVPSILALLCPFLHSLSPRLLKKKKIEAPYR